MERVQRWFNYVQSDKFLPARVLRTVATVIRPTHKPAPINALPPELLDVAFKLLAFPNHNTLWSCMQVSKSWHDIARPHFFTTVPVKYHHREEFSQYVCARPEIATNVRVVRFYDKSWASSDLRRVQSPEVPPEPFDIQVLASTLPLLSNGHYSIRYPVDTPPPLATANGLMEMPPVSLSF